MPVLLCAGCRWWFLVCYVAEPHAVALEAQQVIRAVLACLDVTEYCDLSAAETALNAHIQ